MEARNESRRGALGHEDRGTVGLTQRQDSWLCLQLCARNLSSLCKMKMLKRCQQGHTQSQPPPEGSGNDTPECRADCWTRLQDQLPGEGFADGSSAASSREEAREESPLNRGCVKGQAVRLVAQ
ncbi:hypothetical protein P7K49_030106 [Saguinus oedipus]|uniref:Uncharacterized protein n=1 Tax=Saguinus oedipus TaxID=9490 RepID=A0ABQ9U198_SAGOE|nr:hypothetical protein P7K49_030106 [Saguinus oedipus]